MAITQPSRVIPPYILIAMARKVYFCGDGQRGSLFCLGATDDSLEHVRAESRRHQRSLGTWALLGILFNLEALKCDFKPSQGGNGGHERTKDQLRDIHTSSIK